MRVPKVKVIGGGFSGLIQAFYLVENNFNVEIIEKESRLGGLLGTERKNDFLSEKAANAFIANSELERICNLIGVKLVKVKKIAKKRFIYRDKKMRRWPLSISQLLKLLLLILKIKLGFKEKIENENLKEWVLNNLDPDFNNYLIEPAVQGVFAVSSEKLSAELVFSALFKKYPKGSLRGSVSPQFGMQDFVDKMTDYLLKKGCNFSISNRSFAINEENQYIFAIGLAHLKELHNENKIKLPESIKKTNTTSLTSVKVLFGENIELKEGFGCLFPRPEGFNSLGVLFNHNIFPHRATNGLSETWILNDEIMDFSNMSKMALERYVLSDRYKLFGSRLKPSEVIIDQWQNRLPVYDEKLKEFLKELKEFKTPHLFVGNYLGQLGLSKLIFRAKENVEFLLGEKSV